LIAARPTVTAKVAYVPLVIVPLAQLQFHPKLGKPAPLMLIAASALLGRTGMARVLVVEDEPLIAVMLQEWLVELGYQTIGPAGTVAKSLDLINSGKPDAAVLDVSLGSQDSAAVADLLRERGVPFAFATGYAVNGMATRYPGALTLAKPYDFAAVRKVLAELLASTSNAGPVG
jgi:CheY-like chemotaxis protein